MCQPWSRLDGRDRCAPADRHRRGGLRWRQTRRWCRCAHRRPCKGWGSTLRLARGVDFCRTPCINQPSRGHRSVCTWARQPSPPAAMRLANAHVAMASCPPKLWSDILADWWPSRGRGARWPHRVTATPGPDQRDSMLCPQRSCTLGVRESWLLEKLQATG